MDSLLWTTIVKILIFIALTEIVNSETYDGKHEDRPKYKFTYGVEDPHSKDMKKHHEERDGKFVTGFYTFMEADGSIRVVRYRVGPHSGFEAVVERIFPPSVTDERAKVYEVYENSRNDVSRQLSNKIDDGGDEIEDK